jgi:hypothetical protein
MPMNSTIPVSTESNLATASGDALIDNSTILYDRYQIEIFVGLVWLQAVSAMQVLGAPN